MRALHIVAVKLLGQELCRLPKNYQDRWPHVRHACCRGAGERSLEAVAIAVPDYIAFDVETTGFSPEEDRIIEAAFVRFENGRPVARWSSLVHPGREVGLKILRLTGIDLNELVKSPDMESICGEIEKFRGRLPLVGHNPGFDVSFLSRVIQGFPGVPVYDTLELARIVCPGLKSYKLGDLAGELDIPLCDAHRACDDAEATGRIFEVIQREIARLPEDVRKNIISIMGEEWASACLFQAEESFGHQLSLFIDGSSYGLSAARAEILQVSPDDSQVEKVPLEWLPDMLEALKGHIFVDYPERLDYANVAASLASYPGTVVLAGDVETLPGVGSGVCLLAAPHDYLCLLKASVIEKFARAGLLEHLDADAKRFLSAITVWKTRTQDGLFREIQLVGKGHALSRELSCSDFPDCQEHCAYSGRCFYLRALNTAADSRMIVTPKINCFDLPLEVNASACIVSGSDDLGTIWERNRPRLNLVRLREALEALRCSHCVELVERLIYKSLDVLGSKSDMVVPDDIVQTLSFVQQEIQLAIPDLRQQLRDSAGASWQLPFDPPVLGMNLRSLEYWMEQLQGVLMEDDTSIRLLEKGYGDSRGIIARKALWPAIEAKHALARRFEKVVLVSPNAGSMSQFEGLRRLHGLEPEDLVRFEGQETPKREADSGPLLVSIDKGHRMSYSEHLELTGEFLQRLAMESRENVLCLCPSYSYIRNLNSCISDSLESEGIAVFAQGIDGGTRVLEHLAEPGTMVLARFGVDIKGNSPVCPRILVIPRIPFMPPNTMTDLRQREIWDLGKNGFIEVSVLPVAFALRGYMETLSRNAGKIAVILLDPKLLPGQSAWGKDFMDQFHDVNAILCPPHTGIAQAVKWVSFG
jgi:DNA polymerase III epsilon subunit-like protein